MSDRITHYMICNCYIWPVSTLQPMNLCGRCYDTAYQMYPADTPRPMLFDLYEAKNGERLYVKSGAWWQKRT